MIRPIGPTMGMDWKYDTKHRATNYGGPIKYPDGFGKQTNPPDDRFIDELVHPAGGRPNGTEELSGALGSSVWPSATELEAKQEQEDAAQEEKSRQFRITEAAALGARNSLFDEE